MSISSVWLMDDIRKILPDNGESLWAGMGNYILATANGQYEITLPYMGEPPHGDSFHALLTDGRQLPGYVWGCTFAASPCSRYLAASWMAKRYERRTIVVDLEKHSFVVLPTEIPDFVFHWPELKGSGIGAGLAYKLDGREVWKTF